MRVVIWVVAILLVASAGWHYRESFAALSRSAPPPKPIVFDNGTVRQYQVADPASQAVAEPLPDGVMRKCVRRGETTYTNVSCPAGFKEKPVDGSRMTVVSGGDTPRPAAAAPSPAATRNALRDALDVGGDDRLRERAMDRVIDGNGR
jgi:hypothetical protein